MLDSDVREPPWATTKELIAICFRTDSIPCSRVMIESLVYIDCAYEDQYGYEGG